ncbi:MAG: FliM/FliN family flagellar motor switch protein [Planctomycetes bacterium]|nr:FliM/FliN family flagellar motor switch protein [Planctomycetota bacterium]
MSLTSSENLKSRTRAAESSHEHGSEDKKNEANPKSVVKFDARKPNRLNRIHLRTLNTLFKKVGEEFVKELKNSLRMNLKVELEPPYQERYEFFVGNLQDPVCCYEVRCKQMPVPFFCLLDPQLVFIMVDRYLGGEGEEIQIEPRELTLAEAGIADRLVDLLMNCFREAWKPFGTLSKPEAALLASKSRMEPLGDKEIVLMAVYGLFEESDLGRIMLCIPFGALESFLQAIADQQENDKTASEEKETWRKRIANKIVQVEVGLPVVLGETEIPLRDVVNLKVDDVILIDRKIEETVEMLIGARSIVRGNIGVFENRLALKVSKIESLDDPPAGVESTHG